MMKLVVLLALSSIASSKRVGVEKHINAGAANQGIADYKAWQDEKGTCGGCKDIIADGLLDGIFKAGFLESSAWDLSTFTLTATLNPEDSPDGVKGHLYGEIASASRMPVFWSLDKDLTFVFSETEGGTTVTMMGIHTEPAAQGVGLYEEFMKEKSEVVLDDIVLDEETGVHGPSFLLEANLEHEQDAAFKYLYDWWWNKDKNFDVKGLLATKAKAEKNKEGSGDSLVVKATDQVGKLTPILNSLYGSFTVRNAIGSQMAGIFYQLATVCPSTITTFQFFNDEKDGSARVSATTDTYFDDDSVYARYGFLLKSQAMGAKALLDSVSTMAIAEKAAKSGINFAKMMAYGNPQTVESMKKVGISAGDPSAIANLFSFCEGSIPGENPACRKNTPGRVAWGKNKPLSMVAHRYQSEQHKTRIEAPEAEEVEK